MNIAHYERLLATETDEEKVRTLRSLLAEAKSEALLVDEQGSIEGAEKDATDRHRAAKRFVMRADEYRAIADASKSDASRATYLQLAHAYELLAKQAGSAAADETDAKTG